MQDAGPTQAPGPSEDLPLTHTVVPKIQDGAAAVARRAGEIIEIVGMRADYDVLWMIRIEVVAGARGTSIGQALIGDLTDLAFQRNRVPFYIADSANVRSQALARKVQ